MGSGEVHAFRWDGSHPGRTVKECAAQATDLEARRDLYKGQAHSLANKLNLATAALNDGKTTVAAKMLEAFQKEVNALTGENLTPEQGDELSSYVQGVIDDIGG